MCRTRTPAAASPSDSLAGLKPDDSSQLCVALALEPPLALSRLHVHLQLRPALALATQPRGQAADIQVAILFSELALRIIEKIPRGSGKLGDQLFRSATSIPANIAEGVGKRSRAERRSYYDHARGSVFESGSHLDIVRLLKCVPDEEIVKGKAMLVEIAKMLTVMMRA